MKDLPKVGGRRLEISLSEFERSCLVRLMEIQKQSHPDTALINVLCNAVRLARECTDTKGLVHDNSEHQSQSARVAHDEVPALEVSNTAKLTPIEKFAADVDRALNGIKK